MPMIVCEMQIFISSRGPLREMLASCLERLFASSNVLCPVTGQAVPPCGWSPAGVRPAGAPLGCGRRRAGPRSTEQERGGKSVW